MEYRHSVFVTNENEWGFRKFTFTFYFCRIKKLYIFVAA